MSTADASRKPEAISAAALGKYRMVARLGIGGMAEVYLAVARGAMNVNRLVVIKRLRDEHAGDDASREMFLNEARLAARLNHANVIQTFEAGSENGIYFLAMEYVDGQPFSRILSRLKKDDRLIDPSLAARLCADALSGLHYAHELADFDGTPLEIVHRDVSPQNLMLTYDGVVKLVDFGIAKAAGSSQTAHGVFKGKVAYMAPEQVVGDKIDRRADLFAAGVVLWEALTGKPLIADETPAKTLYNLLNKPLPRVSEFRPDIPSALDDVVAKALERDVDKRFPTAKAMREALEACISGSSGTNEALGDP
jgi:serine/threonine-protein kinase